MYPPNNNPLKDTKVNPWVVRDYPWLNGDYDAHLTATVCRRFEITGKDGKVNEKFPKIDYMGGDWDNSYDLKFWYEVSNEPVDKDP